MTPTELGKRARACKGFRWLPGMLAWRTTHRGERVQVRLIDGLDQHAELTDPRRVETTPSGTRLFESGHSVVDGWHRVEDLTPDLSDPATLGCLLALVREAFGTDQMHVYHATCAGDWVVHHHDPPRGRGPTSVRGRTEAIALLAALEAAP